MTIDDYLDRARSHGLISSDRKLANALEITASSVSAWRLRRSWPADDTMVRLADLAGVDHAEALLELNCWRADSPTVRSVYDRIAHRLAATAAAIGIIAITGVAGSGTARAGDASGCPTGSGPVYIMENNMVMNFDISINP